MTAHNACPCHVREAVMFLTETRETLLRTWVKLQRAKPPPPLRCSPRGVGAEHAEGPEGHKGSESHRCSHDLRS